MSEEEKVETIENRAAEEISPTLEEEVEAQIAEMHSETATEETKEVEEKKDVNEETHDETKTEAAESDDDSPILPAGHRRAALADGWTSEEIDHYLETQPEDAVAEFAGSYEKWRKEGSEWSSRGRQLKAAEQGDKTVTPSESDELPLTLEKFDTTALIEEHGNDELITALTGPLNKVIDQVNSVLGKVSASEEFVQSSTEETVSKIVQDFLTGEDMKPFKDVYGTKIETLSKEQVDKRMELFGEADDIIFGASAHGKKITVENALRRAHANVSRDLKDSAIRQTIRDSLGKRTKTLTGSKQKTTTAQDDAPITREELVARTDARLRAMHENT